MLPMANTNYQTENHFWYDKYWSSNDVWSAIVASIKKLDNQQSMWRSRNRNCISMYSELMLRQLGYGALSVFNTIPDNRIRINVVRSCVDTATSYIGAQAPRIFNLTNGGDWNAQRNAKKSNRAMDGLFHKVEQYEKSPRMFQLAGITGTAFIKPYVDYDNTINCDVVLSENVIVDERESLLRPPSTMYHYDEFSREEIIDKYPKKAAEIRRATNFVRDVVSSVSPVSDQISVVEAWHVNHFGKGRHSIVTNSCTLLDEEWTKPYIPLVRWCWGQQPLGFFGFGIADEIRGIQYEINYLAAKIQTLMTLATTHVLVQKGSEVNLQALTNSDMSVLEYNGVPPVFQAVQAVSGEYFQQLDRACARAYEMTGINQLASQAQRPAGIHSGVALNTLQEVQSKRFLDLSKRYDAFHVKLSEIYMDMLCDLSKEHGSYKINARNNNVLEEVDWAELKIDMKKLMTIPYPTNFLSTTPAAKLEEVQNMLSAGMLDRESAMSLLQYPDLESVTSVQNAPIDYFKMCVDRMIEKGEPVQPDPYSNLGLAMTLMPKEIMLAETQGVPEERIDLLRNYADQINSMLQSQEQQAQAQQAQAQQAAMAQQAALQGMGQQQQFPGGQGVGSLPPELMAQLMPNAQLGIQ